MAHTWAVIPPGVAIATRLLGGVLHKVLHIVLHSPPALLRNALLGDFMSPRGKSNYKESKYS